MFRPLVLSLCLMAGAHDAAPTVTDNPARILRGFRGFVTALAFSPDGRLLAAAGQDGVVRLWDTHGWSIRILTNQPQTAIGTIAFAPRGDTLVSGLVSQLIQWESPDWRESEIHRLQAGDITALAYSRNGKHLAVGRNSGQTSVFTTADWTADPAIEQDSAITGLAFMPGGSRIVTAAESGALLMVDWRMRRRIRSWRHQGGAASLALSRTGATAVSGGLDGMARVWDTETGRFRRALSGHAEAITSAAFSPDNRTLALGSGDGTASLWSAIDWRRIRTITGLDSVTALAWSPDSAALATAGWDKTIRIWRITNTHEDRPGNPGTGRILTGRTAGR